MAGKVNWKQKYEELRSKYMNAIDVAFRLGHEEGTKAAEMEALQLQMQQMEEQAAIDEEAAMMEEEPMVDEEGMPIEGGMEEGMEEELPPEEMEGDDLGQSIDELESYVKGEPKLNAASLMKSIHKSKVKKEDEKPNSKKSGKVASMIKKWNEEDEESTENGEIIGQA